jgi:hypothetical protein
VLLVRLEQYWGMFAPAPNRDDGWYVVEGRLEDGRTIEAFRESETASFEKPESAADFYPNERWRRYMINIGTRDFRDFRAPFAAYLCKNRNRKYKAAERMKHVNLFFVRETTPAPGQPSERTRLQFLDFTCPAP